MLTTIEYRYRNFEKLFLVSQHENRLRVPLQKYFYLKYLVLALQYQNIVAAMIGGSVANFDRGPLLDPLFSSLQKTAKFACKVIVSRDLEVSVILQKSTNKENLYT
jgi:hypothetical protein